MQKFLVFSFGFLLGLIACWNLRVTVSRQDIFDIKNSMEKYRIDASVARSNLIRTIDKIEQCQLMVDSMKREIQYSIFETCKPVTEDAKRNP